MAWAKNGTPHTLSSTADELQISDLGSKKFNILLSHIFPTGGDARRKVNFNNDGVGGTSYASSREQNGTDSTQTSVGYLDVWYSPTQTDFMVMYIFVDSAEEKLAIANLVSDGGSGATNAPNRAETSGKEATNDALTQIDIDNDAAGDFDTGSNISMIGTD